MKKFKKIKFSRLHSLGLILSSFLIIILIGSILLVLPVASNGDSISFIDALFISTSAICVTGLSPVSSVADTLSIFGKVVLAVLIEIGGLGFVTIVMFIAIIFGFKVTFGQRLILKEALNQDTLGGVVILLKKIIFTAFIIQSFGIILCFIDLYFVHQYGIIEALGYSIFHIISSFNNAGFDIFGSTSLVQFRGDSLFILNTAMMIIAGGLGFIVMFDIGQKSSFKRLSLHSKVVLTMTLVLLVFGTLSFKFLNWNEFSWLDAFFMSTSFRTAGFYLINPATFNNASLLIAMALMFFGVGPASTGGGVKITTLFTLTASLIKFATGSNQTHAFKRRISEQSVIKAFILTTFAFFFIIIISFILSISERNNEAASFTAIIFECISAFSTTGFSLNLTTTLSTFSKFMICILMFVGRLGPITFISLFNRNANVANKKDSIGYVEENIIIG